MNNDGYTPMDLCKPELSTNLVVSKERVSDINGEVVENISKSKDNIPSNLKRLTSEYWSVKEEINVQLFKEELSTLFESEDTDWEEVFTSYRGVEGESIIHLAAREGHMRIINKAAHEWDNKSRVLVLSGENSRGETPLHVAAATGELEVVEVILELSMSTNKLGNKKPEEEEQVEVVIETSNPPNHQQDDNRREMISNAEWKPWKMKSAKGDTPLHMALRNGYEEVSMRLIEWDPSLLNTSVNKMNESILYLASLTGCSRVVHFLLRESKDNEHYNLSIGGPDGQNPLHAAIRSPLDTTTTYGWSNALSFNFGKPNVSQPNPFPAIDDVDIPCVKIAGVRDFLTVYLSDLVKTVDNNGMTPLHYATELDNVELLRFGLFSCEKDCISAALMYNNEGYSPLLRAPANGSFDCAYHILNHYGLSSVELEHADNGSTMLHLLKVRSAHALEGWVRIMKIYCKMKILINEIDKDGNTPLHCAILESDIYKARLLLSTKGVRVSIQNKWRQTPMDLCKQLLIKGDSRHLAIWIELEDFVAKENKRQSQVPLLLRINTRVMTSYSDQGMSSDEDLKKLLENMAVAATLLIALTFAATFTIPGGYDQNTGEALRMKTSSVKTFVASNVVAMLLGVGVLLTYTFGATKKAWLRVLSIPCVVMLQCALLATIISFISGVYALVSQDARWIATLAVSIVSVVLLLFSVTPAAAGAVIQIVKWFQRLPKRLIKAGMIFLIFLLVIPYFLAMPFGLEDCFLQLIAELISRVHQYRFE